MIYALGKKEGAYVEDDAGEDTEADVEDDEELVVGKSAENVGPVLLHAVLIEALGMGAGLDGVQWPSRRSSHRCRSPGWRGWRWNG